MKIGIGLAVTNTLMGRIDAVAQIITATVAPLLDAVTEGDTLAPKINGGTYTAASGFTLTGTTTTQWVLNGTPVAGTPAYVSSDTLAFLETVTATHATLPDAVRVFTSNTVTVAATALTITGTPDTTGTVGNAYAFTATLGGGVEPYAVSLQTGTLPAGTSLNTSTGAISGTLTTAQALTGLVLRVTDDNATTADLAAWNVNVYLAPLISDLSYLDSVVSFTTNVDGNVTWIINDVVSYASAAEMEADVGTALATGTFSVVEGVSDNTVDTGSTTGAHYFHMIIDNLDGQPSSVGTVAVDIPASFTYFDDFSTDTTANYTLNNTVLTYDATNQEMDVNPGGNYASLPLPAQTVTIGQAYRFTVTARNDFPAFGTGNSIEGFAGYSLHNDALGNTNRLTEGQSGDMIMTITPTQSPLYLAARVRINEEPGTFSVQMFKLEEI